VSRWSALSDMPLLQVNASETEVGIVDMWRQARGAVMRKEYEDVMARMQGANEAAKSAFLNNVRQTIDAVVAVYTSASKSERKEILKELVRETKRMWASGDWPSALGLSISCLNAESRFVPGEDAAYVRLETDRIVHEALRWIQAIDASKNAEPTPRGVSPARPAMEPTRESPAMTAIDSTSVPTNEPSRWNSALIRRKAAAEAVAVEGAIANRFRGRLHVAKWKPARR
jgi:hypothetical protein